MNKKSLILLASVIVVIAGIAGGHWYYKQHQKVAQMNTDPFVGVTVPSNIDEATRKIYEEKLEGTKKMYAEGPGFWETWVAIGNIKSLFGDYSGALAAYEKSVSLQTNNIVAERNIAVLYATRLNDAQRAVAYYRMAINNEPGDAELYIDTARLQLKKLNQPQEAEKTLLDGLGRTRNSHDILSELVTFYRDTNNQEKYNQYKTMLNIK